MGSWELLLPATREISHFTKKKRNSQSLTIFGWIIVGTAHCKLLQLSTAPPPPIHPEIRMIHGYQAVIIPCFWKRLASVEVSFQVSLSRTTNFSTLWDWTLQCELEGTVPGLVRKIASSPSIYIYGGVCAGLNHQQICVLVWPWVNCMSLDWATPSSEPHLPHCAMRLLDWISGPHKRCPKGNGKTEWEGFLPLHLSHL